MLKLQFVWETELYPFHIRFHQQVLFKFPNLYPQNQKELPHTETNSLLLSATRNFRNVHWHMKIRKDNLVVWAVCISNVLFEKRIIVLDEHTLIKPKRLIFYFLLRTFTYTYLSSKNVCIIYPHS